MADPKQPAVAKGANKRGAARWTLGYSFTGYDAPFDLYSADGAKVATLNRDGMDYFSGTLADGTPVTLWRD